jgi:release factor glutamine methyltransferase
MAKNFSLKELISTLENVYNMQYFDIKKLLKFCLKVDDKYLIIHNDEIINDSKKKEILKYAVQIKEGIPIQYITNEQSFMGNVFFVNNSVLIPQPDTEIVVQSAIEKINELIKENKKANQKIKKEHNTNDKINVLDLCTGSGAIGISIKKHYREKVNVTLSDISNEALNVAKINSRRILNDERDCKVQFVQSDMFNDIKGKFDVIVSNPPYIKSEMIDKLDKDVRNEPHIALDGGTDGLQYYKIIKSRIDNFLNENGYLILEIGYDQKEEIQEMFKNSNCIKDYAGNDRVIIWKRG